MKRRFRLAKAALMRPRTQGAYVSVREPLSRRVSRQVVKGFE